MGNISWNLQDDYIGLTKKSVEMACELYVCGRYNEKKLVKTLGELGYDEQRDNLRIVELIAHLTPIKERFMTKLMKTSIRIAKKNKLI